jgi:hypothetical protein
MLAISKDGKNICTTNIRSDNVSVWEGEGPHRALRDHDQGG